MTKKDSIYFEEAVAAAIEQLASIPGSSQWPVSERLTAFFFMLLDGVEESAEEPSDVFINEASGFSSDFQKALREALSDVVSGIDLPGVNRLITDTAPSRFVVAEMLVQLLEVALNDDSPERERSAALADRTLSFASSILTTPVPQKAVDLTRYAIEAGYLPIDKIPVVGDWIFGHSNGADESAPHDADGKAADDASTSEEDSHGGA
ncbi:MAG: hypothetical protein O2797_03635 [Bacteroidetes bacterium]|nr:hypothetical protein [Bacteroidota bacterium]MDA1333295.1 hypothetical protein [Bacteroidota bacterium]